MSGQTSSVDGASGPGYAGDVDCRKAWEILENDSNAVLVDVRTVPEWEFVGLPDLGAIGKQVALVQWNIYRGPAPNPDFLSELEAAGVPKDATVLFLCRSGARSKSAAITATGAGYGPCYNVSGGFEGPLDGDSHRGGVDGWKSLGLPWEQR
jgi:rhodanese-related sulfurtransferase